MSLHEYIQTLITSYDEGHPKVSDEEFDALVSASKLYDKDGLVAGLGDPGDLPHALRMWSLQKIYPGEKQPLPPNTDLVRTPKLDGCAVELVYSMGHLVSAATRGDGHTGTAILNKMSILPSVPKSIPYYGLIQVTGECVADKAKNTRNIASGIVNTKDPSEFLEKATEHNLEFVAYDTQLVQQSSLYSTPFTELTYSARMGVLEYWGFYVATVGTWDNKPQDGIVYRVDDDVKYNELGFTAKHPKGAYAFKENAEAAETVLREVVWQTGKSGKVTPVGIFDTVEIDGSQVSRATLNNQAYISALGLKIGSKLGVVRAGGIIPKIIGTVE